MKFLITTTALIAATTKSVVQAQNVPGGAGTADFDAAYDALRAATAGSGLTDAEVKLYEEMMLGRDTDFCGCTSSDPHVYTYDGVHSECQASGDFIYSKSTKPDTNFMVQARFSIEGVSSTWNAFTRTTSPERFFGTATKGAVVQTGFPGEPKVEAFAGTRDRVTKDKCEMQWYFDDERVIDLAGGNVNTGHGIYDLGWGIFWRSGFKRYIFFRESGLWMEYEKWEYKKWGCAMNVCVCPSKKIRDQGLVGILGNADGKQDNEFMKRDGTILTGTAVPGSQNNNKKIAELSAYCKAEWCLGDDTDDNIFVTPINTCETDLSHNLDVAIEGASEELKELCLFNERCIADAIVSGDSTVGVRTMETETNQEKHVVVTTRNQEDGQEADVIGDVPIERYTGARVCKQFSDYDFGWKMDACYPTMGGDFDALELTSLRNEASCDASTNPGSFQIECGGKVGDNQYTTMKITPSVDTAVKVRGFNSHNNNGIVYHELKAGHTYSIDDIGSGGEYISNLEFCFRCADLPEIPTCDESPKECPDGSIVQRQAPDCEFRECPPCPADEMTCPDGTVLARDFGNSCEYPACPPCDDGVFECPNGDVLTRIPETCEFPLCPPCDDDSKTCPGGEILLRSPADCAFPECPAVVTDDPMTTAAAPGTRGDPHFKTHGGEMFDFHGGCDLVLVDNPTYKNGLGLTIHIRTKIETWWSFVESAVIKIGEETLEITGQDQKEWIWINGIVNEELENGAWNEQHKLAGNLVRFKDNVQVGKAHRHEAHIILGGGEKIVFKSFDAFLKVEFMNESEATLAGSKGILGTYPEGLRVGRDGVTVIEDVNAYGQEWQVTSDEPKLFHSYDAPWVVASGNACAMPSSSAEKVALRRRRLASGIPTEVAEKACAHLSGADAKACVYDVLATQNTDMAGAW